MNTVSCSTCPSILYYTARDKLHSQTVMFLYFVLYSVSHTPFQERYVPLFYVISQRHTPFQEWFVLFFFCVVHPETHSIPRMICPFILFCSARGSLHSKGNKSLYFVDKLKEIYITILLIVFSIVQPYRNNITLGIWPTILLIFFSIVVRERHNSMRNMSLYFVYILVLCHHRHTPYHKCYVPLFYWCFNVVQPETIPIPWGICPSILLLILKWYNLTDTSLYEGNVLLFFLIYFSIVK